VVTDSIFSVKGAFAALDLAYNVSFSPDLVIPVTGAIVIPSACILDAESQFYHASITFLLTARPVLAFIGPANDSSSISLFDLQRKLQVSVPLLTYAGGQALSDRSTYPHYIQMAFSMEAGVRFVLSALKFYAQNQIAVVYCDDRSYSADLKDSLPSHEAYASFLKQGMQFGMYADVVSAVPWTPTIADFSKIIQQWQAQNLTTALLLLPRISNYEAFAIACYNLGFFGVEKLIFPLTYNSYFTNFTAGSIMAKVSSYWFIAAYRKQYTNLAPYNAMVALVNSPKFNLTQAKPPVQVMFAFDAVLVLNQVMYQSQKNSSQNLLNASILIESIRSTDFSQNDDGHLLTFLSSGVVVWDPDNNIRIGATGTGDYMQMLVPFPNRTRFGTSIDNYNFLPQLDPPNFPDFIPAYASCLAAGSVAFVNKTLKPTTGITYVTCVPCPPNHWIRQGSSDCLPCTSDQWCALNTPIEYSRSAQFFQPMMSVVPMQTGASLVPKKILSVLLRTFTYLGVGLAIVLVGLGVAILALYRFKIDLHLYVKARLARFDVLFLLDHKQPAMGEPLIPQQTPVGGFFVIVFVAFSVFFTAYFIDLALTDQYSLHSATSSGFSDLFSVTDVLTVSALQMNVTFIGLDNPAACSQICFPLLATPSGQLPPFWFDPDHNAQCNWTLLDRATCLIQYSSSMPSIQLPSHFFSTITISNTRVMAIYYQIGALTFLSNMYGLSGNVIAPVNTSLRGSAATEITVVLVPYVFNGTVLKTNNAPHFYDSFAPRSVVVGHLCQYLGSVDGSFKTAAEYAQVSDSSSTASSEFSTSITFFFERSDRTIAVSLGTNFTIMDQISTIAGFIASILLVGFRIGVKVVEKIARNYRMFEPHLPPSMHRNGLDAKRIRASREAAAREAAQRAQAELDAHRQAFEEQILAMAAGPLQQHSSLRSRASTFDIAETL
jgi:hypothetical protein